MTIYKYNKMHNNYRCAKFFQDTLAFSRLTLLRPRCTVELAAHRGLPRQGHVGQRLAAELRRLGDLQHVVRREGEDGGEGLKIRFFFCCVAPSFQKKTA